jgi:hypothetical protein
MKNLFLAIFGFLALPILSSTASADWPGHVSQVDWYRAVEPGETTQFVVYSFRSTLEKAYEDTTRASFGDL